VTGVPFCDLHAEHSALRARLHAALDAVLDGPSLVLGPQVEAFEREFATWLGVAHCVGVSSGTDALELALRSLNVGPGCEVIVPAATFAASAIAVCLTGATPVFCDVDDEGLLSVSDAADMAGPRTRAVVPVHLYGRCVDVVALRRALPDLVRVVEDACQAHGAKLADAAAGTLGDAAAFSFYPTKNLGALGDGGAVTTASPELASRLRCLRQYGSADKYRLAEIGRNARLDELQAAFLRIKLNETAHNVRRRRALVANYRERLAHLPLRLPRLHDDDAYHLFAVRAADPAARDGLLSALTAAGIGALIHYPVPLHEQAAFAPYAKRPLPGAERWARCTLSLPLYPTMTAAQQDAVVAAVTAFYRTA
jgi:dTDP-4-amino-4,6-dideoxygalactose transaminase